MGDIARITRLAFRAVARFAPGTGRLVCSGCDAGKSAGVRFVSGPGLYLCGDCIARAATQLAPRQPPTDGVRCRFCRSLRPPADVTRVGSVMVCADCLGVMVSVLAEAPPTSPRT